MKQNISLKDIINGYTSATDFHNSSKYNKPSIEKLQIPSIIKQSSVDSIQSVLVSAHTHDRDHLLSSSKSKTYTSMNAAQLYGFSKVYAAKRRFASRKALGIPCLENTK